MNPRHNKYTTLSTQPSLAQVPTQKAARSVRIYGGPWCEKRIRRFR